MADDDHVLIVAMDHLIADAASLVIVLRDMWTLYAQYDRGQPVSLPPMPIQLADYAVWQGENREAFLAAHGRSLAEAPRGRPSRTSVLRGGEDDRPWLCLRPLQDWRNCGLGTTRVEPAAPKHSRNECSRHLGNGGVPLVLDSHVVVPFLAMGRPGPEVENTNGCFAAPLYLRIQLQANDSFLDVLRRVTEEYATACEHDDLGYIGAQLPRPDFTYNSCFNWHPREFRVDPVSFLTCIDLAEVEGLGGTLRLQPLLPKRQPRRLRATIWSGTMSPGLLSEAEDT